MIAASVVIPTRNRRLFLSEAIATVMEQTFLEWELIVVDDGSTDDTQDFLRTLHDPRIRSIRRESQGGPTFVTIFRRLKVGKSFRTELLMQSGYVSTRLSLIC